MTCAFCDGPDPATHEINGDPACEACREAWEAEAVECEKCGELVSESDSHWHVTSPATPYSCRIEDAHEEEGRTLCKSCFERYDPERLQAQREDAAEARNDYMREMED